MKNVFPLYTQTCEQTKRAMNIEYGKKIVKSGESLIIHQSEVISELLEENAKYKAKILSLIERDLVLVEKYAMPDFKLGLRHAKTIILMEGE